VDLQVHDTMFVVAHLHYVLIGGAVFPLFGAFYYWFPKWTGRMLSESLGRWNVALLLVGFHMTFWPLHHLGLHGMPRRVYTYNPETGWGPMNHLASMGAGLMFLGVAVFLINALRSRKRGELAGPNPWGGETLEWAAASPPKAYNFAVIPTVHSLHPLWDEGTLGSFATGSEDRVLAGGHEVLRTSELDGEPEGPLEMPEYTAAPFVTATAMLVAVVALLLDWKAVAAAFAVVAGCSIAWWLWPRGMDS
jgi:cytochrome c oxidase subunit I+III